MMLFILRMKLNPGLAGAAAEASVEIVGVGAVAGCVLVGGDGEDDDADDSFWSLSFSSFIKLDIMLCYEL